MWIEGEVIVWVVLEIFVDDLMLGMWVLRVLRGVCGCVWVDLDVWIGG